MPPSVPVPRSYLYVPGDQPARLERAPERGADALIADLEDSVAPSAKERARECVSRWITGAGRPAGPVWVRVNAAQARADIAAAVWPGVAGVVVPKAEPPLLAEVSALLGEREQALGVPSGSVAVLALIETAAGLLAAPAVAAVDRVVRLGIGEVDLAAELNLRVSPGREEMTPLRLQVVVASAAAGIAPPVAPVATDIRDLAALRETTDAALGLGFRARTAIHPAQLAVINEVFTPSAEEISRARHLITAFERAERLGTGVITGDNGEMIDLAVVRSAREVLARAGARSAGAGAWPAGAG
jgi:citrate lyase subunit beta / citryl-CoA lyase